MAGLFMNYGDYGLPYVICLSLSFIEFGLDSVTLTYVLVVFVYLYHKSNEVVVIDFLCLRSGPHSGRSLLSLDP